MKEDREETKRVRKDIYEDHKVKRLVREMEI